MALQSFTRNYEDNSTEAGFQFTFYCDICQDGFKSQFVESTTYKKRGLFRGISEGVGIGARLLGLGNLGYGVERGGDILSERFNGMSPEWQREHERAFEQAKNEAMNHFHRCHKCHLWVCDADFNEEEGLCVECSPRMNVEIAVAKGKKMVKDIEDRAENTVVFDGDIEKKTIVCPQCGKPCGEGKFCSNCGAPVGLNECPRCGATAQPGAKFCNECGNKLR